MRRVIGTVLCAAMVLAACGGTGAEGPTPTPEPTPTPTVVPTATPEPVCRTSDGRVAYDLFYEYYQEWSDALDLAGSTPRIQLGAVISDFQRIRREIDRQEWPDCARSAQSKLVAATDILIEALLDFYADADANIDAKLDRSVKIMEEFWAEMRLIRPS
jgi:hypothetical protein